jgi:repressor LexA
MGYMFAMGGNMDHDLTPRQQSVLGFIRDFHNKNSIAPTVREIRDYLGLQSPGGIHRILNVLKDKGYLLAESGKKRSWRLARDISGSGIPVVGAIAAGGPIEAIENIEESLKVEPEVFGCDRCFGVRVQGDSMIGAQIADGDVAIIRPQSKVENGEIAAVLVEDVLTEATLKIVQLTSTSLTLKAANPKYRSMIFRWRGRERVTILGKFVGIIRRA